MPAAQEVLQWSGFHLPLQRQLCGLRESAWESSSEVLPAELQRWAGSAGKHFAWRCGAKPPRRERLSDEELRKREAKAASVPQAGEGKRTAVSKELYLQTGEEGSKHEEQSTPAKGFAALLLSTNQSGPLLYLDQEMKLHLGLPHLWFLLGSPRADPLGLLPLLKVLWHLKNNAAFT